MTNYELTEQMLAGLISQGLSGQELLTEFIKMNRKIKTVVNKMIIDADKIAKGQKKYATMSDIFGDDIPNS